MTSRMQQALYIRDTISQNTQSMSLPILRSLFKIAVLPFLVVITALYISEYARIYVDANFQSESLSLLTGFSTTLIVLLLTWWAWRWSEVRFGGWANVRGMLAIVSSMARLESVINLAQKDGLDDSETLDQAAQNAWQAYTQLAHRLGLEPA